MITGVVLARNEERNIVECLKSFRPCVAELILIDMESSDRTVELARPFVNKVLTHRIVPNFDAARNIAIPEATYDWLWFLDADERVPLETGRMVNELVRDRGNEFSAITIPFKNYFCGRWIEHCGWWPGYTMQRVLKRGAFRFSKRLHGGVEFVGREFVVPPDPNTAVEHFSYRSIEHYVEKFNRYTSVEARQLAEEGAAPHWQSALAEMVRDLWLYYERNEGVRDGHYGWVLSWLAGQYRWFSQTKLLDFRGELADMGGAPRSLDEAFSVMEFELARLRAKRPTLPLGIVWRSPIWDASGYADDSRVVVQSLAGGERPLHLEELPWSDERCELPRSESALLKTLVRARRPSCVAAITNCIPTLCQPDPCAAVNILRTTFETDRIPAEWLPRLNAFDEIWVLSQHNRESFRRGGAPPERIRVLGGYINTDLYWVHCV